MALIGHVFTAEEYCETKTSNYSNLQKLTMPMYFYRVSGTSTCITSTQGCRSSFYLWATPYFLYQMSALSVRCYSHIRELYSVSVLATSSLN